MARADILSILYSREKSPLEFKFDSLWAPPLYSLLPPPVIDKLRGIATSVRLASKIKEKYQMITQLVEPFGFKKFHAGTNRVIYRHLEYTDIVLKVAVDEVGMLDNPKEFYNQQYLKPFVTKTFEVSPCGTVAIAERVEPVTTLAEFQSIAEDIFDLIVNNLIGEFILEDIGTKYFRNWGLRKGFGPVLLDYPYMFRLDGNRLYCNSEDPVTGQICDGVIDYDAGFNKLVCTNCGREVLASDLKEEIENNKIEMKQEELFMKLNVKRGNEILYRNDVNETRVIRKNKFNSSKKGETHSKLRVSVTTPNFDTEKIVNVNNEISEKKEKEVVYNVTSEFMKPVEKEEVPKIDPDAMAEAMMSALGVEDSGIDTDGDEEKSVMHSNKYDEESGKDTDGDEEKSGIDTDGDNKYEEYRDDNIQTQEKIKKKIMENF